ncbi:hypothetical protein AX16_010003 [Volvariella volvacea WC 439]|nr:hypothetical protein AX16_010003 [Volvariella volvacea WC 439]
MDSSKNIGLQDDLGYTEAKKSIDEEYTSGLLCFELPASNTVKPMSPFSIPAIEVPTLGVNHYSQRVSSMPLPPSHSVSMKQTQAPTPPRGPSSACPVQGQVVPATIPPIVAPTPVRAVLCETLLINTADATRGSEYGAGPRVDGGSSSK